MKIYIPYVWVAQNRGDLKDNCAYTSVPVRMKHCILFLRSLPRCHSSDSLTLIFFPKIIPLHTCFISTNYVWQRGKFEPWRARWPGLKSWLYLASNNLHDFVPGLLIVDRRTSSAWTGSTDTSVQSGDLARTLSGMPVITVTAVTLLSSRHFFWPEVILFVEVVSYCFPSPLLPFEHKFLMVNVLSFCLPRFS